MALAPTDTRVDPGHDSIRVRSSPGESSPGELVQVKTSPDESSQVKSRRGLSTSSRADSGFEPSTHLTVCPRVPREPLRHGWGSGFGFGVWVWVWVWVWRFGFGFGVVWFWCLGVEGWGRGQGDLLKSLECSGTAIKQVSKDETHAARVNHLVCEGDGCSANALIGDDG